MKKLTLLCPLLILAGCSSTKPEGPPAPAHPAAQPALLGNGDSPIIITDGSIRVKKHNGYKKGTKDVRFDIDAPVKFIRLETCNATFDTCTNPSDNPVDKSGWDLKINDPSKSLLLELHYPDNGTNTPDPSGIQLINNGSSAPTDEPATAHEHYYDDKDYPDGARGLLYQQYRIGWVSINNAAPIPCSPHCRITLSQK